MTSLLQTIDVYAVINIGTLKFIGEQCTHNDNAVHPGNRIHWIG